jgi:acetyl-CoA C-acetyltransferase
MNQDIVIVSAVRTAVGRFGGSLKEVNSSQLGAIVIKEALRRSGISESDVDEVILGEVRQSSESSNVSRIAALRAGIPETASAFTVNRLCASGLQAIGSAVQEISFGLADIVVAGGVENMSRAPIYLRNARFGEGNPTIVDSNTEVGQQPVEMYGNQLGMGITAENVAQKYGISRLEQDTYALLSQNRARIAIESGSFKDEIVPVPVKQHKQDILFDTDEHPRNTTLESLSSLQPAFKKDGTVTAGNACGRNDGAAAFVLMSRLKAEELGIKPLARIVDWTAIGVSPEIMGIGPVPAIQRLLDRTNKRIEDIGRFELNEAFASQALAVIREANLDIEKVNVNGGAIALGHPLGATGAKITVSLLYEMIRSGEQFGISTLCVGGGQGMALMIELL